MTVSHVFKPGDEIEAGQFIALVESWAAYGAVLAPQTPEGLGQPVVMLDVEAIVDGQDERAKARLLFTEEAAHELLHGIENSLQLLVNLRRNQEGPTQ